ncbi:MAG: precorrin-6y C5,15-methyltransferase (decarboxylating) subunit CbiE [Geminicoccaceae bacterium]|nr:precorrin-6y C5,15-methyltransferase (decarboxylating) subunit CbiE [Geminicoccaceae bacterium]
MSPFPEPWIEVVGVGCDGLEGLPPALRALVEGAEAVVGGARHLAFLEGPAGRRVPWRSPLDDTLGDIAALRGRRVAVLATGDPSWFGVARLLRRRFGAEAVRVHPSPSAFQLAAARLGWAVEEALTLTAHGRPVGNLRRHLAPGRRLLVLTGGSEGPAEIAALVRESGYGASEFWVLEQLGGPEERLRHGTCALPPEGGTGALNLVALHLRAAPGRAVGLAPGLDDGLFAHDGQITKREVRALTVAALGAFPGETLWDVGAGSGSVAVEWLRIDPTLRAVAVERRGDRCANVRANAERFGLEDSLRVVEGEAPEALPEGRAGAVFVGGGVARPSLIEGLIDRLRPGGRLVANAVTLAGEARLLALHARFGGDLTRIEAGRAAPLGDGHGFVPMRPVTQWRHLRPEGA